MVGLIVLMLASCSPGEEGASPPESEDADISEPAEEVDADPIEYVEPQVDGDIELVYQEYGLPDTTGWSTAIVFTLTNPTDHPMTDVTYRVEVLDGDGQPMERVSATEPLALRPGESRVVVETASPTGPNPPQSADVRTYEAEVLTDAPEGPHEWLPVDPVEDFVDEDGLINCDTGTTACEASGDLTWEGGEPIAVEAISLVVRSEDGVLVAAGHESQFGEPMRPGRTVAYELNVTPSDDFRSGGGAGELDGQLLVHAYPTDPAASSPKTHSSDDVNDLGASSQNLEAELESLEREFGPGPSASAIRDRAEIETELGDDELRRYGLGICFGAIWDEDQLAAQSGMTQDEAGRMIMTAEGWCSS